MSRPSWEDQLWQGLDDLDAVGQVRAAGELIMYLTQELIPSLAKLRKLKVVEALMREGMDSTMLAETIGTRRSTISRLATEGRSLIRNESSQPPPPGVG